MTDRLPPLTALRAFEAAARHMSFAKAADELSVTPAALPFQIKSLEEHLGEPLFIRLNRAVKLTKAGETLAPGLSEGFHNISTAWNATKRLQNDNVLTVTAGPALTAKWLAPRIYEFARAHPEIELRFSASLSRIDLQRDGVDVAIRFGYGPDDGYVAELARREWITPAMTPEFAKQFDTPESLIHAPLVYDDSISFLNPKCDWNAWFKACEIDDDPPSGPHFSSAEGAIEAACAGVGVVLGRRPLIIKDVLDGRLVVPFKIAIETDARFRFLCLPGTENRPQIATFRDWYLSEIERTAHIWGDMKIIPVKDMQP